MRLILLFSIAAIAFAQESTDAVVERVRKTFDVPGIAVAGDGAGIAGGTAAAERGRIAAIAAVRALKPGAAVPDPQIVRQALQREQLERLASSLPLQQIQLPFLLTTPIGPNEVGELARALTAGIAAL